MLSFLVGLLAIWAVDLVALCLGLVFGFITWVWGLV